jgi:DNA polymerase III subunit epsilon
VSMLGGWMQRLGWPSKAGSGSDPATGRWVVLDLETSGLDPGSDRVLSVGAVGVSSEGAVPAILLRDSLELTVSQLAVSSRDNILIHGIGEEAQRNGLGAADAGQRVRDYLADSPILAWHAPFDRGFLTRALRQWGAGAPSNTWIDVAELAPVLFPGERCRGLDDWLERFAIPIGQRHNACADAFATALLFVKLLSAVPVQQRNLPGLRRIASQARWLSRDRG